MSDQTHYCQRCDALTAYKETLERKPSSYDSFDTWYKRIMLVVREFINGGHYFNMDRYLICKVCGHRTKENLGNEFE